MSISALFTRRFVVTAGVAATLAVAPAIAALTTPSVALANTCPNGETEDTFTGVCVPDMVPNSPFQSLPGNPDVPAVSLPNSGTIPCTGANSGECIGLSEEQQASGPQVVPHSTVGGSPTVTGHIG